MYRGLAAACYGYDYNRIYIDGLVRLVCLLNVELLGKLVFKYALHVCPHRTGSMDEHRLAHCLLLDSSLDFSAFSRCSVRQESSLPRAAGVEFLDV